MEILEAFQGELLLLLGTGVGWLLARAGYAAERVERRRSLTTALLHELRWVEDKLRQIATGGPTVQDVYVRSLEATYRDMTVIKAETVEAIVDFDVLTREVQDSIEWYRLNLASLTDAKAEHTREAVRGQAVFALRRLAPLVQALRREGGVMPTPLKLEGEPVIPDPPEPVFPLAADTRWQADAD